MNDITATNQRENTTMIYRTPIAALGMAAVILIVGAGCTTTDPYTGEQVIDENATAALVGGLALGAVAYAAASDDDDDRYEHHHHHRDYRYDYDRSRRFSPARNVVCYDHQRTCYRNGHHSKRWTRRTYGSRY
jgi:hypothetical protein